MMDDYSKAAVQAERCRRIASQMTDDEIRLSLEELAREYEESLRADRGEGFMLRGEDGESSDAARAR